MIEGLLEDVKHAVRSLRRSGGFAITTVLLLACGLGVATLMLGLVYAVNFRPLPYPRSAELVGVRAFRSASCAPQCIDLLSAEAMRDVQSHVSTLRGLSRYSERSALVGTAEGRSDVDVAEVSDSFFVTLGVPPHAGRWLSASDFEAATNTVAVVSYRWWRRQGASPDILSRTITIDGVKFVIVGIMPADFVLPGADVWIPIGAGGSLRDERPMDAIARMRTGVTVSRATQELQLLASRELQSDSGWNEGRTVFAYPLDASARPGAWSLRPLVAIVVLIVIATYANAQGLFVVRALRMRRDLAIRAALGAPRWRIVQYWCVEAMLVVAASMVVAALVTLWGGGVAERALGDSVPSVFLVGHQPALFLFGFGLATAAALTLGWRAYRAASTTDLRGELAASTLGDAVPSARLGIRGALVIAQIIIAVLLSAAAGALYRSYSNLNHIDLGFDADRMLAAKIDIRQTPYDSLGQLGSLSARLVDGLRALPLVSEAAVWRDVSPISLTHPGEPTITVEYNDTRIDGRRCMHGSCIHPIVSQDVTPAFFRAVGARIVRGRAFDSHDQSGAASVAIVNEFAASRWWPHQDPIGKRFKVGGIASPNPWLTVVGVAAVERPVQWIAVFLKTDDDPQYAIMFRPLAQVNGSVGHDLSWAQPLWAAVRTRAPQASGLAHSMKRALHDLAPDVTAGEPVSFRQMLLVEGQWERIRTGQLLAATCALFAIGLGMAGVYGVISDLVTRRSREMGIRLALGARPNQLVMLIVRNGLRLAAFGVTTGLCVCLLLGAATERMLFGESSRELYGTSLADPIVLLPVAIGAIAACLLASWIPALRLSRLRPARALSAE